MQLGHQLGLLHRTQVNLAAALRDVAEAHADEVDVFHTARRLAGRVRRARGTAGAVRQALP